ncbi:ABC transporter ATP-binding protein [Deinococcus aquiradiocola]|uniref:ABC transporter ATP-binding protein n=1 Tax=Deinococcus aquiradiocola TaxID=393059 RepID=A0A917P4J3_9DEIO|nr:ABC transporter ATP-binding protein [Deinococcus aquiradiocola]GGJ61088.1 ABC transporter ATP-binding protein [Deinococcus aquiradiocola]
MTGSPAPLELTGLSKRFSGGQAVSDLSFTVRPGELYALLGTNGAGKTTTLRMIAGLLEPDGGDVRVYGHSVLSHPLSAKRVMAYLPDDPMLYGKLRAPEYLEFVAGLWGIPASVAAPEAQRLLVWLELWEHRAALTESFSRGMKQKLALAGALVHSPRLMLLDEPLTGLDAAAARQVKDALRAFVDAGGAVVLTTHIMEVAEQLSDRIGVIRAGRLVAQGTLAELREQVGHAGQGSLEDVFLELVGAGGRGRDVVL